MATKQRYYFIYNSKILGNVSGLKDKTIYYSYAINNSAGYGFTSNYTKTGSYTINYNSNTYTNNTSYYCPTNLDPSNFLKLSTGIVFYSYTSTINGEQWENIIKNSKLFISTTISGATTSNTIDITNIVRFFKTTITDNKTYCYVYFDFNKLSSSVYNTLANKNYYVCHFLMDIEAPSSDFTVTENLTGLTGVNNPTTVTSGEAFTLNYKANDGYEISVLTSNIGTVTISDDKTTATITGTATENIVVSGTANLITYTVTNNLTNITGADTNPTILTQNEHFELTYTTTEGFTIDDFTTNIGTITISEDNTTATVVGNATENIVITGVASDKRVYYTVTENLTNITSDSDNKKEFLENNGFSLGYTVLDGYEINTLTTNIGSVYIASNKTFALVSGTATENIVITGVATEPKETYTVTETLTNITSVDTNPKEFTEGEKFTLQYTSYNGYKFKSLTSNIGTVTISDDKLSASITGVATDNITVTGLAYLVTYVYITGTINNATCNYTNGEEVDTNKQFQIIANTGYEFLSSYKYKESDGSTSYLTKSNDNTMLYKTLSLDSGNYTFDDNYTPTKKVQRISTFCNLYKVTEDELTQLSKKRIQTQTDGSLLDYGEFITNLYILPFKIPDNYLGENAYIVLGNYDTKIASTLVNNYMIEINGGTCTIKRKFSNIYDYMNITPILHIPFFDPITLDINEIMGYTITLSFILDVYSGTITYNLYSSRNNRYAISSSSTNITTQIPFIQKQNNTIVNQLSNVYKNYYSTAPTIELVYPTPYYDTNVRNKWGYGCDIYDRLMNFSDSYTICDDIIINGSYAIPKNELDEIKTLLQQGVYA